MLQGARMAFHVSILLTAAILAALPGIGIQQLQAQPHGASQEKVISKADASNPFESPVPLTFEDIFTTRPLPAEEEETPPAAPITEEQIRLEFEEALDLIQRGRAREAKTALQQFVMRYPQSPHSAQSLYQIALLETEVDEAIQVLQRLGSSYPDSPWAHIGYYKLGELHFFLEQYEQARHAFEQYLVHQPKGQFTDRAQLRIIICLMRVNNYVEALRQLAMLQKNFPEFEHDPAIIDLVGECYAHLGYVEKACEYFQMIVAKFPNYTFLPKIYLNLGLCQEELNRREKAEKTYAELTRLFPDSPEASLGRVRIADLTTPFLGQSGAPTSTTPPVPQSCFSFLALCQTG